MGKRRAGFIGKREAKRLNRLYEQRRAEWRASNPPGRVEVTEGSRPRLTADPATWGPPLIRVEHGDG